MQFNFTYTFILLDRYDFFILDEFKSKNILLEKDKEEAPKWYHFGA
jgi:hypothetical protein